jgi:hypothetical protein
MGFYTFPGCHLSWVFLTEGAARRNETRPKISAGIQDRSPFPSQDGDRVSSHASTRDRAVPFASAFESLIDLSTTFAQQLQNAEAEKQTGLRLGEVLAQALLLVDRLVSRINTSIAAS